MEAEVSNIAIAQQHQASTDVVDNDVESTHKSSEVAQTTPVVPFKTTPAHKAAKTRSLKTLETYSAEESESLFPSNAFVRLKISPEKLRQSGIPVIKTRWEEKIVRAVETKDINGIPPADFGSQQLLVTTGEDVIKDSVGKNNTKSQINEEVDNVLAKRLEQATTTTQQSGKEPRLFVGADPPSVHNTQSTHDPAHTTSTVLQIISDQIKRSSNRYQTQDLVEANSQTLGFGSTNQQNGQPSLPQFRLVAHPPINGPQENGNATNNWLQPDKRSTTSSQQTSEISKTHNSVTDESEGSRKRLRQNYRLTKTEAILVTPSQQDPSKPESLLDMAPVRDPNNVDTALKDAIQKLYEVQSQVHGFVPETQPLLIDKMTEVAHSLAHLQTLTSTTQSPNNPIHKNRIAPEVIDYVDDSRNPDIYNREFVELVQRGNAVMNGKQQAFRDFSEIFAKTLKERMPELAGDVDRVMENAGMPLAKSDATNEGGKHGNGSHDADAKPVGRGENVSGANGTKTA